MPVHHLQSNWNRMWERLKFHVPALTVHLNEKNGKGKESNDQSHFQQVQLST